MSEAQRVTRDELVRLAAGAVSADEKKRLFEALRHDEAAARQYRVLVLAERALAGGDPGGDALDVPSDAELDGLLPGILDATSPPVRSWKAVLAAVPVVVAAAAGLLVFVRAPNEDEFRARGGVDVAVPVEVFCVVGVDVAPLVNDGAQEGACARGGSLVVRLPKDKAGSPLALRFTDADRRDHAGVVDGARGAGVVQDDGLGNVEVRVDDDVAVGSGVLHVVVGGSAVDRPLSVVPRR